MTREEIMTVTESDQKGCEAINKAVHEKLGLCWHKWERVKTYFHPTAHPELQIPQFHIECVKCKGNWKGRHLRNVPRNPDYTHDIKAAWAIKEWLSKHQYNSCYSISVSDVISEVSGLTIVFRYDILWASPLDRCKAFLLMNTENGNAL
jgi:hypothetical protein